MSEARSDPTRLSGAVGLVTGGNGGIGSAVVSALRSRGAVAVALDLDKGVSAASSGGSAASPEGKVFADVRDFSAVSRACQEVVTTHGRLDFVVANAALADWGSMSQGDPVHWQAVIDTNVLGVANTVRATLPLLMSGGRGHVVIVSSISGRVAYAGEPIYIATKWALVGLGMSLRKEVREAGIRVSLIEPGIVDTPMTRGTEEGTAELSALQPLVPADIARAVLFVLEQPSYVNIDELMLSPIEQSF